jgi:hypothetical protein
MPSIDCCSVTSRPEVVLEDGDQGRRAAAVVVGLVDDVLVLELGERLHADVLHAGGGHRHGGRDVEAVERTVLRLMLGKHARPSHEDRQDAQQDCDHDVSPGRVIACPLISWRPDAHASHRGVLATFIAVFLYFVCSQAFSML